MNRLAHYRMLCDPNELQSYLVEVLLVLECATVARIQAATNLSERSIRTGLEQLIAAGLVRRTSMDAVWRLVPGGGIEPTGAERVFDHYELVTGDVPTPDGMSHVPLVLVPILTRGGDA